MTTYLYTYACSPEEKPLCQMEMRALFGCNAGPYLMMSKKKIDPKRSPFIRERIEVMFEGETYQSIAEQANNVVLGEDTFKVHLIKDNDLEVKLSLQERRRIDWSFRTGCT